MLSCCHEIIQNKDIETFGANSKHIKTSQFDYLMEKSAKKMTLSG